MRERWWSEMTRKRRFRAIHRLRSKLGQLGAGAERSSTTSPGGLAGARPPALPRPGAAIDLGRTDTYKSFMGWSWFVNSNGLAIGFHRGSELPQWDPEIHQFRFGRSLWAGPEYFCDPDDIFFQGDAFGAIQEVIDLQTLQWRFDNLPHGENMLLAQAAAYRSEMHDLEIVLATRLGTDAEVVKREIHTSNRGRSEAQIALVVQGARVMWLAATRHECVDLFGLDGNGVLLTGPKSHKFWDKGVRVVGSWHCERAGASGHIVGHGVGRAGNRLGYLGSPAIVRRFLCRKDEGQYPMERFADLESRLVAMSPASEMWVNNLHFAPATILPQAAQVSANYQYGLYSEAAPLGLEDRLRHIVDRPQMIEVALSPAPLGDDVALPGEAPASAFRAIVPPSRDALRT